MLQHFSLLPLLIPLFELASCGLSYNPVDPGKMSGPLRVPAEIQVFSFLWDLLLERGRRKEIRTN